jgi:hypothetical protein
MSCIWSNPRYESDRKHTVNVYTRGQIGAVNLSVTSSESTRAVTWYGAVNIV